MRRPNAIASIVLGMTGLSGWCGQLPSGANAGKPDYSQEAAVVENMTEAAEFHNDGTASYEYSLRARIQSDAGVKQFGILAFGYAQASQTVEIEYVRVVKPGGTVVTTPPQNIQDLPAEVSRDAPFYSDLRQKHVAVRGLSVGDVLEYRSHLRVHTPEVPGHFWLVRDFDKSAIFLHVELEVSVPRDREIKTKFGDLKPVVTEAGQRRIYRWKTANLERKKDDDQSSEAEEKPPDVQLTTFRSFEEVGRWYDALQRERVEPTAEVRAQAAELTKGASTDAEKLKALYNYVALNFRYVGIAFGIGRYQPHPAGDVLANQYGDCKDKHTLLASLIKAVGLKAYPVLISSSRKPDPEMPSPGQFNHLITAIPQGDGYIWLDTTAEVAPFGFIFANLRDKYALVIPDDKPPALVMTPNDPPFPNATRFVIEGKLDEQGTLEAKAERTHRGDAEVLLRAAFRRTPQPQWKDLVQALSSSAGFGGTVDNIEVSPPEANDIPFRMAYDYKRKDYPDLDNKRITMPCPSLGLPVLKDKDEEKREKLQLGPTAEFAYEGKVTLPPDYTPDLPPPVDLKEDFAEYHSTYEFKDGVVHSQRRLITKTKEIPKEKFEAYRAFAKAANEDESRFVKLQTSGEAAAESRNPEADKLFEQGRQALARTEIHAALDYFKKTAELAPDYPGVWFAIGQIESSLRRPDEGLAAFRKEVELHPTNVRAYKVLGFALMAVNRNAEAIQVWESLLTLEPKDRDAPGNLGLALMRTRRYKDAVPVLQTEVEVNPNSSFLNYNLAMCLLETGEPDRAVSIFRKAAELDPTPSNRNSVAYILADKNLALPDALRYAELAAKEHEEQTLKIDLERLGQSDLRVTALLGAIWDTVGWVHFRSGDLDLAERYVSASWSLSQHADQADHLGQIFEKKNKKAAAIRAYAWALALRETLQETRDRITKLAGTQARVKTAISQARDELSQLRTIKLRPLVSKHVTAEFFVLFSQGPKVEDVKFISGAEELRDAAKELAKAKFDVPFPNDRPTRILRRGILMCHSLTPGCEFVLLPPDSVQSVN